MKKSVSIEGRGPEVNSDDEPDEAEDVVAPAIELPPLPDEIGEDVPEDGLEEEPKEDMEKEEAEKEASASGPIVTLVMPPCTVVDAEEELVFDEATKGTNSKGNENMKSASFTIDWTMRSSFSLFSLSISTVSFTKMGMRYRATFKMMLSSEE